MVPGIESPIEPFNSSCLNLVRHEIVENLWFQPLSSGTELTKISGLLSWKFLNVGWKILRVESGSASFIDFPCFQRFFQPGAPDRGFFRRGWNLKSNLNEKNRVQRVQL